jgi:hypothetical protein
MIPLFILQGAAGRACRQPPTMVIEFPAPHIAVLRPNPSLVRARKLGMVAFAVAVLAGICLPVLATYRSGHKSVIEAKFVFMMLSFFGAFLVVALVARSQAGSTKSITFDRRQGMVYKEARKLEPVWQGGIRLRDISAIELASAPSRGAISMWELSLASSTRQDIRASLTKDANLDALRANAAELSRFLSIPFTDRSSA